MVSFDALFDRTRLIRRECVDALLTERIRLGETRPPVADPRARVYAMPCRCRRIEAGFRTDPAIEAAMAQYRDHRRRIDPAIGDIGLQFAVEAIRLDYCGMRSCHEAALTELGAALAAAETAPGRPEAIEDQAFFVFRFLLTALAGLTAAPPRPAGTMRAWAGRAVPPGDRAA